MKEWLKQIFLYPQDKIVAGNFNYDLYWKDKRGKNIGALSSWQKNRADFILKVLRGSGKSTFLDIGSGDGSVLDYLTRQGLVSHAIGVDISADAGESLKNFGIEFIEADITDKQFLNNIPAADYAILFEVLEHIQHSEEMLEAAYRKINKGLFFSFPNTGFFTYRFRLLFGKFPLQWRLFPGEHIRFWTRSDLNWWLKALGYKGYKIFYYKGVPILNKIWPSLFAAGFVVYMKK